VEIKRVSRLVVYYTFDEKHVNLLSIQLAQGSVN